MSTEPPETEGLSNIIEAVNYFLVLLTTLMQFVIGMTIYYIIIYKYFLLILVKSHHFEKIILMTQLIAPLFNF